MAWGRSFILASGFLLCGLVAASPAMAQAPANGAVGKFELHADASMPARTVSFGQLFVPGTVQRGDRLQVLVEGRAVPTQIDAKAFNADGSVRHAIVTLALPQLSSGKTLDGQIVKQADAAPAAAPAAAAIPALTVTLKIKEAGGAVKPVTVDLQAIAQNPKNVVPGFWINGPLAQERRYMAEVNERLQILFDVFTPAQGPARIDVILHNDWTGIRHDDNFDYDVEMRLAGSVAFQARDVHQYSFSTWHRLLWTDGKPSVRVVPDLASLSAAGAVPRYNPDFKIAGVFSEQIAQAASKAGDKAMEMGIVDRHMPDTGGRMDIGPLPAWAVIDLLDPSESSRKVLLSNGDAAGSVPWHLRDRKTGQPLTIDAYPTLWMDSRGTAIPGVLPEPFNEEIHGWTMDDAHQPSLSYLPYLLTGSQYYRDELAAQAAFVLFFYDPNFRGQSHGLFIGEHGEAWQQVRGVAWSLRTLATAAYILPANDPMRGYFDAKLKGNLAKLVQLFIQNRSLKSAGPLEGWFPGAYRPDNWTAPWQQGFMVVVLNWINDMGYSDAGKVMGWMSNFIDGLFTSGDQGFNPESGASYMLQVYDAGTERRFNSWAELFQKSDQAKRPAKDIDDNWTNYGLIMRAATGATYGLTGSARSRAAYEYTTARSNRITWPEAKGDPTFAIQPRAEAKPAR
ncbi:MAG: hypothetical protein J0I19_08340 [Alphaproteobacteria bacterium]|nr:hypothetical protein [Alphaproteobacteria bacterium]